MVHSPDKAVTKKGKCCWDYCLGNKLTTVKHPCGSNAHKRCKKCGAYLGNIFLCNSFVKGAPMNCRQHYHIYHHNKESASMMVINQFIYINLPVDMPPNLQAIFPRCTGRSPVRFIVIAQWQPWMPRPFWPSTIFSILDGWLQIEWKLC